MNLSSNRVFTTAIETGEFWLNNVALPASGNYADAEAFDVSGFSMIRIEVDAFTGVVLNLPVWGNVTNSDLKLLQIMNAEGEVVTALTATGTYFVDVSGINFVRLYTAPENSATAATVRIGYGVNPNNFSSFWSFIEKRRKIVEIASVWIDASANDVQDIIGTYDVSQFSYYLVRVRTRDATTNTYETRDFDIITADNYTVAEDVSSGGVNGGSSLETIISTTSDYDIKSGWIECLSPEIILRISNGETSIKRYEINLIGIR